MFSRFDGGLSLILVIGLLVMQALILRPSREDFWLWAQNPEPVIVQ